jgi:hypothetical protein
MTFSLPENKDSFNTILKMEGLLQIKPQLNSFSGHAVSIKSYRPHCRAAGRLQERPAPTGVKYERRMNRLLPICSERYMHRKCSVPKG